MFTYELLTSVCMNVGFEPCFRYLKPFIWSYMESNGSLSEQWKAVIGRFTVMWNKEIWGFSAISVNFWLTSECGAFCSRGNSPKYGFFLNMSLVGTYIRVNISFPWSSRWNRSTGMTFTWILIQISSTYLNLGVVIWLRRALWYDFSADAPLIGHTCV